MSCPLSYKSVCSERFDCSFIFAQNLLFHTNLETTFIIPYILIHVTSSCVPFKLSSNKYLRIAGIQMYSRHVFCTGTRGESCFTHSHFWANVSKCSNTHSHIQSSFSTFWCSDYVTSKYMCEQLKEYL